MSDYEDLINACKLILETDAAFKLGIKHYNKDGKLLEDTFEVLEALQRDGLVEIVVPKDTSRWN